MIFFEQNFVHPTQRGKSRCNILGVTTPAGMAISSPYILPTATVPNRHFRKKNKIIFTPLHPLCLQGE